MASIAELLARAAALRDETALNSISPERAGGIMYDTLVAMNELWLQQGAALVISKIYASVEAMEADTAPVSDLTGQALRPGQIVVIASSDEDNGSVYRYDGTADPSWSAVGNIGAVPVVDDLTSDSSILALAARQGKVLDGKIAQVDKKIDDQLGIVFTPSLEIEGGNINDSGADAYNSTKIRTANYIECYGIRVTSSGNKVFVVGYRADGAFVAKTTAYTSNSDVRIPGAEKYRLVFGKSDDTDITPADFNSLGITIGAYTLSEFARKKQIDDNNAYISELADGLDFLAIVPEAVSGAYDSDIRGSTGAITSASKFAYKIFDIRGYSKIRFLGIVSKQTVSYYAGYAFGSFSGGTWTPSLSFSFDYDAEESLEGSLREYVIDVPAGATHFAVTSRTYYANKAVLNEDNFFIHLIKGTTIEQQIIKSIDASLNEVVTGNEVDFEQAQSQSDYQQFNLLKGVEYKIYMKVTGLSDANIDAFRELRLYSYPDNNHQVAALTFDKPTLKAGAWAMASISPTADISACRNIFYSTFVEQSGNRVYLKSVNNETTFLPTDKWNPNELPLAGKNVVMFGDSLTQMPRSGSVIAGDGIVEVFARYSSAIAHRGAFGGSHLSARTLLTSVDDIVSRGTAIAAFDLPYIVDSFVNNDYSLQEAAWNYSETYLSGEEKLDAYWRVILNELESIDSADVDFVTILSGINDYTGAGTIIGDETDADDITTVYGAWEHILTALAQANINVFIFTPLPYRSTLSDPDTYCPTNGKGLELLDYVEANLNAARRYNYPACDLFHSMGWNNLNFTNYYTDGTHPKTGFPFIARKMCQFITSEYNK